MLKVARILFSLLDKEDKKKFIVLLFSLLLVGMLSLVGLGAIIPFIMALLSPKENWLVHHFPHQPQQNILLISVGIIIIAFWLKNVISYYCTKVQTNVLFGIAYKFSRKLFKLYMNAPYLWYLSRSTPEIVRNVMNECSLIAGVLNSVGSLLIEIATSTFILILLLYINVKFTILVGFSLFFCIFIFLHFTKTKLRHYANNRARIWTEMSKAVMQGIGGIKETKLYGLEKHFIDNFNQNTSLMAPAASFLNIYSQAPRFVLEIVTVTVFMFVIGLFLFHGHQTNQIILLLSVFGVAAMQLLPSLNRLMTAVGTIKYSLPALILISQELNDAILNPKKKPLTLKEETLSPEFHHELSIEKLSFAYPNGTLALDNISLVIHKGQSVALVGHSGSGKTTLADILLGLLKYQSGKIRVDGLELSEHNLKEWQQHLGYIPQSIYLYDCTIKENIAFGENLDEIDESKIWQALEVASMKEFVKSLPEGLNTEVGENGVRLSGGQRQRIGIARALYRNPTILVMDEATAALDNQTEKEVTQAIQKAAKNRTVITIAHRLSTIKNSHVIYVMEKGKVIAHGTYDSLIQDCPLFAHLVQIETTSYLND